MACSDEQSRQKRARLMPEKVGFSRLKLVRRPDMPPPPVERAAYVELGVTSPFSFLRGASDELVSFEAELPRFCSAIPSLRHVAASRLYRGDDAARIERLDRIARANGCTILATNDVHYHVPDRRPLQDIVTCIREKVTIATAGYLLNPNAERHLKTPEEMARLFARWPHAISATRAFADSLSFSL